MSACTAPTKGFHEDLEIAERFDQRSLGESSAPTTRSAVAEVPDTWTFAGPVT